MLTLVLLRFRPLWLYERNTAPVKCYPSSWHELPSRVSYCFYLAFFLWLIACGKRQTSTRPGSGFLSEIYVQMFKTSKYNPNSFIHFLLHKFIFSTERHFYCANRPLLHVHVRLLSFEQSYFFLLNTLLLLWCRIVVDDLTVMTLISDPRVKLKYQHLITNSFVQCNRLLRWCPSPDCSNAIKVRTFLVVSNSYSLHPDPAKNPDPSCFWTLPGINITLFFIIRFSSRKDRKYLLFFQRLWMYP